MEGVEFVAGSVELFHTPRHKFLFGHLFCFIWARTRSAFLR